MSADGSSETLSEARTGSKNDSHREATKASDTKPSDKSIPRRSLFASLVDRAKAALREPEFPLVDQKSGKILMTRRDMLVRSGLTIGGAYATYKLPGLIDSVFTGEMFAPKDYDPRPEDIHAVRELITQTDNMERPDSATLEKDTAKKYDLHFINYPDLPEHCKTIFKNYHDYDWGTQDENVLLSFDDYFNTAKEILAMYDVKLELGDPNKRYREGGRILTHEEKENVVSKKAILKLLGSFFDQPIEVIKQTGLKKVVLIKLETAGGYVDMKDSKDTYYVDPTQERDDNPFDHEIYHLYDINKGGRYFLVDKSFSKLNPPGFYYTDDGNKPKPEDYTSFNEYDEYIDNLTSDVRSGKQNFGNTPAEISTNLQEIIDNAAHKVATVSDYSFTSVAEDKAELGRVLFKPTSYGFVLDERKPFLREKFIFLLARLYRHKPNLVKYFLEVRLRERGFESFSLNSTGTRPEDLVTIHR